ncbi:MAG: 3-phosphoshikimate 1-carboxyvinyltransferase [Clostridia bacterium]|nr:3-phosphoshikimate 1-carboxyvinyltransferase [Clostridia bacterium]
MKIALSPSSLAGAIDAPLSKSYAHRLLIAAALSGGSLRFGDSADAFHTATGLSELGFAADFSGDSVRFGAFKKKEGVSLVHVGESGSTLRFLLPLAAALGVSAEFVAEGRLGERPMGALVSCLASHGVTATALSVSGRLASGLFEIDATVSSQFVTGLLMALPILSGDSELRLVGKLVSSPYVEITLEVLRQAGIEIEKNGGSFLIRGNQTYRLETSVVQGDYSGAAFFLAAGALGEGVSVRGLTPSSAQGDKAIVSVLKQAGAVVKEENGAVTVRKGEMRPFTVDIEKIPDLAPILSVVAAFLPGESVLESVARLKDKESDRLLAIRDMLKKAGIRSEEEGDSLRIFGGKPRGAAFGAFSDHRMAMSEAVLAAFAEGNSEIDDGACVKKSYAAFWRDYETCGGKYEVER